MTDQSQCEMAISIAPLGVGVGAHTQNMKQL